MNSRNIADSTAKTVQGVDFSHQVTLSYTPERRITRHFTCNKIILWQIVPILFSESWFISYRLYFFCESREEFARPFEQQPRKLRFPRVHRLLLLRQTFSHFHSGRSNLRSFGNNLASRVELSTDIGLSCAEPFFFFLLLLLYRHSC